MRKLSIPIMALLCACLAGGCPALPRAARAQSSVPSSVPSSASQPATDTLPKDLLPRDTLRVAWRDAVPTLDPYTTSERTGIALAHEIWDTLVERDPESFQLRPSLAVSWRQVDDRTLAFKLRPGVRFHDGAPFTAEDVVYTVHRVLTDPTIAIPGNYAFLAGAEATSPTDVLIHLKYPFAPAMDYLAMTLPILPHSRARVGPAALGQAPVGTGPYRVARVDGVREIDLLRNDAYFAAAKPKPAIRQVVIHEVRDEQAEIAALTSGQADWIWMFDPDRIDAIARNPHLTATRSSSLRVTFLQLDAAGRSGATNPLTHLRVRQAIFHAIDRAAIARPVLAGGVRVLDAPCDPTQFGCEQAVATHYAYDPDEARDLLAQAGYANGFTVDLVSTIANRDTSRLVDDLKAVNITVRLHQPPLAQAMQWAGQGRTPMLASSWGSSSIGDVSAFLPRFFGGGKLDTTGDAILQDAVRRGDSAADPDQRRRAYSEAIRRVTEQAYFLPLHTDITTYAFSRALNFKPEPDELPRFYAASWR